MTVIDAYWVKGDGEQALVKRKMPPQERTFAQAVELLPEFGRQGDFERACPGWPDWLAYECGPNDDRRIKFAFADAIGSFDPEIGAEILVSESAVKKLEPHLRGHAEFYPAKVANTPEPYYLLWVKRVVDALDYQGSVLAPVAYLKKDGVVPSRIVQAAFKQEKISDLLLFRLSPGQLTLTSLKDYATAEFLKLVKNLGVSGFHFYRNHSEKPVVPVKTGARR